MAKKDNEPMILEGDCVEVMKEFDENTFDAVVTDPPYGLEFMNKDWDKLWRKGDSPAQKESWGGFFKKDGNPRWRDTTQKEWYQMQLWHIQWLTEAYRILKPGGSMLVMGGTRTFHRLMVAIEDSGFIIKDCLMWIYGSGFPKAQDLGKMIDKRGAGRIDIEWTEFRRWIRKKLDESSLTQPQINNACENQMAGHYFGDSQPTIPTWENYKVLKQKLDLSDKWDNWIKARNPRWEKAEREKIGEINKARAEGQKSALPTMGAKTKYIDIDITIPNTDLAKHWDGFKIGGIKPAYEPIVWAVKPPEGSYIDNVLKWGVGAVNVDECRVGTDDIIEQGGEKEDMGRNTIHPGYDRPNATMFRTGKPKERSGPSNIKGRFPANIILDEEAGRAMDEQSGDIKHGYRKNPSQQHGAFFGSTGEIQGERGYKDSGGASRFFYCAKASRGERNKGLEELEKHQPRYGKNFSSSDKGSISALKNLNQNNHPTVKPIKLFEYLIKLVTRKGQIIIDPFLGSGTTMIAANNVDRECVGIEKEGEYIPIAEKRVEYWLKEKEKND